jgi:hypothetical protein
MPFQTGNSGFPAHQRRAKLFAEALRMEIAAAGDDHKALRRVARALLADACKTNVAAASMIADRLDGKVPQPIGGRRTRAAAAAQQLGHSPTPRQRGLVDPPNAGVRLSGGFAHSVGASSYGVVRGG